MTLPAFSSWYGSYAASIARYLQPIFLSLFISNSAHSQSLETVDPTFDQAFSSGQIVEALSIATANLNALNKNPQTDRGVLAARLVDVARALLPLRRSAEATKYLNQALSVSTNLRQRTRILNLLAIAFIGTGKVEEAERLLRYLVRLHSREGASGRRELGQNFYDLGTLQRESGRLDDAEVSLQRSLTIRRDLLGDEHFDVAASLTGLGNVRWQKGEYRDAKGWYDRALKILDTPLRPNHPALATALNNLGSTLVELGKFEDALNVHDRALAIRQNSLGPQSYEVSVSLNNLGNTSRELGRLYQSETMLKRALAIREQSETAKGPSIPTVLNNLALVYAAMDRHEDAEKLYLRAIEILENRGDAGLRGLGQILSNLGRLHLSLGQNELAVKILYRAYEVSVRARSAKHHEIATALNFLASAETRTGRYDDAISHLQQGLGIREESLGRDHPHTGITRTRLGEALYEQGKFIDAEPLVRQGLTILQTQLGKVHPETATALRLLGSILVDRGELANGIRFLQDAAAAHEKFEAFDFAHFASLDQISTGQLIYGELVRASWIRSGKTSRLTSDLDAAFSAAQLNSRSIASTALSQMSARFGSGSNKLSKLVRSTQDLSELRAAIDGRLFAAITSSANRDEQLVSALRNELAVVEERLLLSAQRLKTEFPDYAIFARPPSRTTGQVSEELRSDEALIVFFNSPNVGSSNEATYVWVVTRGGVRWAQIPLGTSALSEKVAALRCGLDSEVWEGIGRPARCARLLGMSRRPRLSDPLPFHLGIAHQLYQVLFGPIEDLIKDKHLLIVPSGPLTSLPFQVLVTAQPHSALPKKFDEYKGVAWLGRRQPLTVLPSVASLQALRKFAKASKAERPYLGYGDPMLLGDGGCRRSSTMQSCTPPQILASANGLILPRERSDARSGSIDRIFRRGADQETVIAEVRSLCPLPDTAFELRCVAKSLSVPESEIRLGPSSTEADIKRLSETNELEKYRVVHFATHGLLAGDTEAMARRQGEPALVMTPPDHPKDTDDDGLLTASEVAQLRLDADWVILSACNTAAGEKLGAEAFSGLARAFFYAGTRAILVSHWPVYSDAAVQLLDKIFAELRQDKTTGRSEALRRATIALMDDPTQPDNPHPSVWAPFTLVGEGADDTGEKLR